MSTLIAVAHGSRDPRSARTVATVVDRIRARRPDLDVRVAFLDLTEPSVEDVVDDVVAGGAEAAVIVPLLLGSAFHARVDLPAIVDAARRRHPRSTLVQSEVLGDDRLLVDALRDRILEAGVESDDPDIGIAVAAVGSSSAPANLRACALAERVRFGTSWRAAVTCFATAPSPGPAESLTRLRAAGARTLVVAPWFLAPGLLTDRVSGAIDTYTRDAPLTEVRLASVLGDHALVAEVVSNRYDAAARRLHTRRSA